MPKMLSKGRQIHLKKDQDFGIEKKPGFLDPMMQSLCITMLCLLPRRSRFSFFQWQHKYLPNCHYSLVVVCAHNSVTAQ